MDVQLVSYTQLNPALTPATVSGFSDLHTLWQGKGTPAENVIEYAARVCYRSGERMGTAPGFIQDCVQRGHMDVIEHGWATFSINNGYEHLIKWALINRYITVTRHGDVVMASANLRAWLDLVWLDYCNELLPDLMAIAPAIFGDEAPAKLPPQLPVPGVLPTINDPQRVALLAYNLPTVGDAGHGSATFLFEGVSRSLTHQHVRHRVSSQSQESQRYVDMVKGQWSAIIPPSIQADPAALAIMNEFWAIAEEKYQALRELGIKKEDARYLLPNAAETRIVTTMNFAGWAHFFELRALDKAAQWEIRAMAQSALKMLYQVAPAVFEAQMDKLNQMEGNK